MSFLQGSAINNITNKINQFSQQVDNLTLELTELEHKEILNSSEKLDIDTLYNQILYLLNHYEKIEIEDMQILAKNIVTKIEFDGVDTITITF